MEEREISRLEEGHAALLSEREDQLRRGIRTRILSPPLRLPPHSPWRYGNVCCRSAAHSRPPWQHHGPPLISAEIRNTSWTSRKFQNRETSTNIATPADAACSTMLPCRRGCCWCCDLFSRCLLFFSIVFVPPNSTSDRGFSIILLLYIESGLAKPGCPLVPPALVPPTPRARIPDGTERTFGSGPPPWPAKSHFC